MQKILEFLKPTTKFGKIAFTLYLVGVIVYTVTYVLFLKYPTGHMIAEILISTLFWFIGAVGLIMYIIYLLKKRKN